MLVSHSFSFLLYRLQYSQTLFTCVRARVCVRAYVFVCWARSNLGECSPAIKCSTSFYGFAANLLKYVSRRGCRVKSIGTQLFLQTIRCIPDFVLPQLPSSSALSIF